jgi:hypothetical protein
MAFSPLLFVLPMNPHYEALREASTIDDLVHATSNYLKSWTREDLDRLPASCRPGWVRTARDIEFWADRLFAESESATLVSDDERRLDRMTNHFLIASVRLRQIAEGVPTPSPA